ncbi:membrane protein insertase, YidC/Oxa1 family domain containing protein [Ancylobacter novellus DSM 506]|uniref:Membrane protein insertase YidC n=1 Tax=Ancylobacter novellus (strain ATCC 8093 / DSM 506 / JCM 20403 / CCM 1077 / IAM 12100 / NBRC 12443 / NCIMB 10456) TaxID=639283 RepID=D7A2X3_ANCN5|nr:membrane protein insertase YidC [Ancylobacter novellus]ADH87691.1 membrane protein insertase, YidC/Oxa1 family domain containing protein [Ancylobacter novellus DSM 506]
MTTENRNMIIAIVLSMAVLIAWQYFSGIPQMEQQRQQHAAQQQAAQQQAAQPSGEAGTAAPAPGTSAPAPAGTAPKALTRAEALARSPRAVIDTPRVIGSVALKGGRIDDLSLKDYRETVDPNSPIIVLLSPSGGPNPFYAEFGWVPGAGASVQVPNAETLWTAPEGAKLTHEAPLVLSWDNGAGLIFRRTLSIDANYMFHVVDEVENTTAAPVALHPYGLVSRHGTPHVLGYYILHEGLIGVTSEAGLHEIKYKDIAERKTETFPSVGGWLGITDKYWAATVIPGIQEKVQARFSAAQAGNDFSYQTDFLGDAVSVAPGAKASTEGRLFAGAKEVRVVDGYQSTYNIDRFDLLIDWGWFYFITKPLFLVIDWIYKGVGNFGVAILIVTVMLKIVFFPLANKSYASMAKMKAVQPEITALRERYGDDRVKLQQEMMEIYKKEKINPVAGCLPIVIQIPVFFALYKVLFVTIEMRHAPFFGWIKDLSAPDPTTIFNLFGLIPWDPGQVPVIGHFLLLGVWPIIMGITMWAQMKLNPAPPDPTQKAIFDWMPLIFTFMLGSFASGLVIYWAWNNTLSVIQQSIIMRRNGVKIELWDNVKELFGRKKKPKAG